MSAVPFCGVPFGGRCTNIRGSLRNDNLSFNHHKKVAKLKDAEQSKWLNIVSKAKEEGRPISVRQLGTFIIAGKVLSSKHADNKTKEKGDLRPIPVMGRLCAWWKSAKAPGRFDRMTSEEKQAVGREIYPVVEIYHEIQRSAAMPDPVTGEIDPKPLVAALKEWWKWVNATGRIQQLAIEKRRELKHDLSIICREL